MVDPVDKLCSRENWGEGGVRVSIRGSEKCVNICPCGIQGVISHSGRAGWLQVHKKKILFLVKTIVKVSVKLKILIDGKYTETEFLLHSGSDIPLILIPVFSSLGGVLTILCILIMVIKRRRRRLRQDAAGDPHHIQSPLPRAQVFSGDNLGHEEDDWSSVDLNSPGYNNSHFFNRGFTVYLNVILEKSIYKIMRYGL